MQELEIVQAIGQESVVLIAVVIIFILIVKPKDRQIEEKWQALHERDKQIDRLLSLNESLASESKNINEKVADNLSDISNTMEKISGEMKQLSDNQRELKDGQDELWREVVKLKGRED